MKTLSQFIRENERQPRRPQCLVNESIKNKQVKLLKELNRLWCKDSKDTRRSFNAYVQERCEKDPEIAKVLLGKNKNVSLDKVLATMKEYYDKPSKVNESRDHMSEIVWGDLENMGYKDGDNIAIEDLEDVLDFYCDGDEEACEVHYEDVKTDIEIEHDVTFHSRGVKPFESRKRGSRHRVIKESENWYRGVPGARMIWHGEWADPEIIYKGIKFNLIEFEDWAWEFYRSEHPGATEEDFDNMPVKEIKDYLYDYVGLIGEYVDDNDVYESKKPRQRRAAVLEARRNIKLNILRRKHR